MSAFLAFKYLHIATVILSIFLFVLRFFWKSTGSAMLQQRWVKITPHAVDTLLLVSGIALLIIARLYPFSPQTPWLTEKLFGVIIYIALGFVALSKRPRRQTTRWIAFILAIGCLALIVKLAVTQIPLLLG
jgi:uncharacterized membrane protein SirB2